MLFRFPQKSPQNMPKLELNIEGISIEQVKTFDFLGLVISETLSWQEHVSKISLKISKVIGVKNQTLGKLYNTFKNL